MLHEFALDPIVLNNWKDFRFFIDRFGVEHGRLISRFPKHWKRLVYQEARVNCTGIELKRIEERLGGDDNEKFRSIDHKLIKSGRPYNGQVSWLENGESQQITKPFHAIISNRNPRKQPFVLIADDIDETEPLWNVPREKVVARQAVALAGCCALLLQMSKEIIFVDPYFDATETRWRKTLEPLLELACWEKKPDALRLEIHAEWRDVEGIPRADALQRWFSNCQSELPAIIPHVFSLKVVLWERRAHSERIHPRYVLTDVGGIRFEGGLDEGKEGETTDVSLLLHSLYEHRWRDYQRASTAFDFVDESVIVGTRDV